MKLILETKIPESDFKINHKDAIVCIGSCFADNIGKQLKDDGFKTLINPLGILFDPASIRRAIAVEFNNNNLSGVTVATSGGAVNSNFHSSIIGESPEELAKLVMKKKMLFWDQLSEAKVVFVTFGTAWVHKYLKTGDLVANCHKLPAKEFEKCLLDVDKEYIKWMSVISGWQRLNPKLKVVFTVSPVRHAKNGLRENNISKGILHLIIHKLQDKFEGVHYFPSYEIVMDELRDYRYFKEDMVHPNEMAVNYIYEKLVDTYFSKNTEAVCKIKRNLNKAKAHRFMNASDEEKQMHQKLIENLEQQFQDRIK
ncbi:MAG: GSCFA domain-containing protein [Crocinitomicaceae bacterium]